MFSFSQSYHIRCAHLTNFVKFIVLHSLNPLYRIRQAYHTTFVNPRFCQPNGSQVVPQFPIFPTLPILPHFPRFPALPTLPLNPLHPQKIPKNELAKFVSFALKKPRAHRAALLRFACPSGSRSVASTIVVVCQLLCEIIVA